jgi:xanthine dehydrogenase accessory factor
MAAVIRGLGRAAVARAVELRGFGSRRLGEVAVIGADGSVTGQLLGAAADRRLAVEARDLLAGPPAARVVDVVIGEAAAVEAGLACGGVARVLVQDAGLLPTGWWEAVAARRPVALVTPLGAGPAYLVEAGEAGHPRAVELLAAGGPAAEVSPDGAEVVEVWWPTARLLVVGAAELAGAITRQAALLGWEGLVSDGDAAVTAVGALGPTDAVVVLSHDPAVAIPVLATALTGGPGFVGALGSRRTQANRRERLVAQGLDEATIDRIHGPVGLDLGARTPEETALAICAEIVAARSGRAAGALRDAGGPING